MSRDFVFSSKSLSEGHPDKLCDQVSDAIVGHVLQQDPCARVSVECAVSNGILFLAATFATTATVDLVGTAREVIGSVGYVDGPFSARTCTVMTSVSELPPDRRLPVSDEDLADEKLGTVAVRDHTTVFGYACTHTPVLMPLPIWLAHKLTRQVDAVRRDGTLPYLAPEAKTLVSVEFHDGAPARIFGIGLVCSQRRAESPPLTSVREDVMEHVIRPAFAGYGETIEDLLAEVRSEMAEAPPAGAAHTAAASAAAPAGEAGPARPRARRGVRDGSPRHARPPHGETRAFPRSAASGRCRVVPGRRTPACPGPRRARGPGQPADGQHPAAAPGRPT